MLQTLHLINNMRQGGAQTTLRRMGVIDRTYVLQSGKNNRILALTKAILQRPRTIILCAWLYHAALFACILKILFFKKVILVVNIRNGYASPGDLKFTTRLAVRVLSTLTAHLAQKVNFCSRQSLNEHNAANLFMKTSNHVIYNGIVASETIIRKQRLQFSMIARFEPQKNYALLKEILHWFDENERPLNILTDHKTRLSNYLAIHNYQNVKIFDNNEKSASEILAEASHHLLLSKSEGFANVNLEALNHGCSIICTAVGDAGIFPEKWCTIVAADRTEIINVLNKTNNDFDRQEFEVEAAKKLTYLEQHFPPKKETDYIYENTYP